MMARWIVAFSSVMRIHFQPEVTIEAELKDILSSEELRILKESSHRYVTHVFINPNGFWGYI